MAHLMDTSILVRLANTAEETPDIFPAWKSMVEALGVIGKQVHDARLVAVCHVHGVANLLTFNIGHFTALGGFGPGVAIVDPANV
jgi:hypothetical protein